MKVGVLTISDSSFRGEREDVSGLLLANTLQDNGFEVTHQLILPDDADRIAETLLSLTDECNLVITTGGTGFAPRDVTPEATARAILRPAPGLAELLRWTGYQKNPRAVLSRGLAGIRNQCLIINLPGSPKGVAEGLEVLLPLLPHAIALICNATVDH